MNNVDCWLLQLVATMLMIGPWVAAHSGGLHGLQGFDPPPEPALPDISGPFEITVKVRFDEWNTGGKWQRVFDFGNGLAIDNISLTQFKGTRRMQFSIFDCADGSLAHEQIRCDNDVIDNGVVATWKVGIDASGWMYMIKDGTLVVGKTTTCLPKDVTRTNKYLGDSHWSGNEKLQGAVLGIRVRNLSAPSMAFSDLAFQNMPSQILVNGDFTISFYARFDTLDATVDHPNGSQHIFDFAESSAAPTTDQIYFAQVGTTTDVEFSIERNGLTYAVTAVNAIVVGEFAFWHVAMVDGFMSIQKNTNVLASSFVDLHWIADYRRSMLIGESSDTQNRPLDGAVLGLRIDF